MREQAARPPLPWTDPAKLLANPTNRAILTRLARAPSYPRAIAWALGLSEGDAQRKLHRLEAAGLVTGTWHHDGKTVKAYHLAVAGVTLGFSTDGVTVALKPLASEAPRLMR